MDDLTEGPNIDDPAMEEQEPEAPSFPPDWLGVAPDIPNLLEFATDAQAAELGNLVKEEYEIDRESCSDWRKRMERGLELATMLKGEKSYPWPKASNVKYPLITLAAMSFNENAYPAVVPAGDIVKAAVHGKDRDGSKRARGERIAGHMSFQLRKEIPEWEPGTDKLTITLPIAGTMFRKTYFDTSKDRICSKLCRPGSVIVNNAVTEFGNAPRVTEEIPLYPTEIIERQRAGIFRDGDWWSRSGKETNDSLAPHDFIEQHRPYDLDGDGYPEPYVITVHRESETVVRIAANWSTERGEFLLADDKSVISLTRNDYYEDFHFVPSPDGGFYSLGYGVLLGDTSASIDAALNMMFDAEHFASWPAGFIGSEARLKGGKFKLEPGKWEQVPASGQDLRAAMVQVTAPGASGAMFNLLGLLIEAGREVANVKDVAELAGKTNQPATTTLALIEQGQKSFSAIYKRLHRSLASEYARIARINRTTVDPEEYNAFHDEVGPEGQPVMFDPAQDYDLSDMDVTPVSDPASVTSQQRLARGQLLREMAANGEIDPAEATMRVLEAAGVDDTEALMPKPNPMAEVVQKMEMANAESALRAAMLANVKTGAEVQEIEAKINKMQAETDKAGAQAADSEASAVKKIAEAEAADPLHPVNIAKLEIERLKARMKNDRQRTGGMAPAPFNGAGAGGVA